MQRYPEAAEAYTRATAEFSDDVDAYYGLELTYMLMGKKGEALGAYKKLLGIDPKRARELIAEIGKARQRGRDGAVAGMVYACRQVSQRLSPAEEGTDWKHWHSQNRNVPLHNGVRNVSIQIFEGGTLMDAPVDLYNTSYDKFSADVQRAVRSETYGEDIGQSSWITADELRHFIKLLHLNRSSNVLEIGSGSGGPALFLAEAIGCRVAGLDINKFGINNSNELAQERGLDALARFQLADASQPLPFGQDTFDAIISNDAMCHVPKRFEVLKEWHRVLKPGGQMLFTDALVITGLVSHEEIARRSSIGYYYYVPAGVNEKMIEGAGFELVQREDLTSNAATVSRRWHDARAKHREEVIRIEGESNFEGLQEFLWCVYTLTSEGRLSRYMYLARKPKNERV